MRVLCIASSIIGEKSMSRTVFENIVGYSRAKGFDVEYDEVIFTKVKKKALDSAIEKADLIVFTTSPFHCDLQSAFVEFVFENFSDGSLKGKPVAGFISSSGLFDKFCEAHLRKLLTEMGAVYISGYSTVEYKYMENHNLPADAKIRTGNNIDDMCEWFMATAQAAELLTSPEKSEPCNGSAVILTSIDENDEYRKKAVDIISKRYPNVEVIDLNKCDIKHCIGCKYCYTNKVCCIKDDMLAVEKKVYESDTVIHLADVVHSVLNPVYTKFVQREIYSGLYPFKEAVCKKIIRVIKSNGYDVSLIREHHDSLGSFGRNFADILIDDGIERFAVSDYILTKQVESGTMSNMNGYTKIYNNHFADLAQMLPNLLVVENEFFKNHPYCKPSTVNDKARPVHTMDDTKMAQMARIIPVSEFFKDKVVKEKKGLGKLWKR